MTVKTVYDWAPGGRGHTLVAKGSTSPQGYVSVGKDGAALLYLYRSGGLYGSALADAEFRFGTRKEKAKC